MAPAPGWSVLPAPFRALGRWLTLIQLVGYSTSLVHVWHTTRMVPGGIAEHYRGADPSAAEGAMQFPKSFTEMLTITHTHLLAMAAVFAFSGLAFALCERVPPRWQRILIVEPLVALLVSFTAMWLMRYVDGRFAWLLQLSSTVLAVTFYLQCAFVLRELGWRDRS